MLKFAGADTLSVVAQNSDCECFFFFFARSSLAKQFRQRLMGE